MKVRYIFDKFFSLLGLCQKAGKLASGSVQCDKAIRSGKVSLVIVSNEASEMTLKQFEHLCKTKNTQLIAAGSKEELGRAVGKGNRTVLAVLDEGFKKILLKEYQKIQRGGDE